MKDKGTAYIWWLFGAHRFYLGRPLSGLLQVFTLGGLGIWWLIDLFSIPNMVKLYNYEKMQEEKKYKE
jgi:TM2 domain-containing membrane protein YozV